MESEEEQQQVWACYSIPDDYPEEILRTIGYFTLLCGQVDRLLIEYLVQQVGEKERRNVISEIREKHYTFGKWIGAFRTGGIYQNVSHAASINSHLEKTKDMRDRIHHDSLLQEKDNGQFVWLTNGTKREHKIYCQDTVGTAIEAMKAFKEGLKN